MAAAAAAATAGLGQAGGGRQSTWGGSAVAAGKVGAAVHAVKLAIMGVTRKLVNDDGRLPLENRTMAVLVDGSRMSFLALELAGAVWKFGR